MMRVETTRFVIYPLRIELDVLHRLRLGKQNHLLDDVHLIVGIDGLMELSIIWKTQRTSGCDLYRRRGICERIQATNQTH